MPKKLQLLSSILMLALLLTAIANAKISVHDGESIQKAIDTASAGETIEVYSGNYQESLNVKKTLILRGIDSGSGLPLVETDRGSAITINAHNVTIDGFRVWSTSGWSGDGGIIVASDGNVLQNNIAEGCGNVGILLLKSDGNILRNNFASENHNEGIALRNSSQNLLQGNQVNHNRYGIKLAGSAKNTIHDNSATGNRFEAIYMDSSEGNLVEDNYILNNWGGITLDSSKDNIIAGNDILDNEKGIYLSSRYTGNDLKSEGKGVYISYSGMPSDDPRRSGNNTIYLNNLSNAENAYDNSLNRWDNGTLGNNYSDFNDPEEGCTGKKICRSEYRISGGSSIDKFPLVAVRPPKVEGKQISSPEGAWLLLQRSSFLPGRDIRVNFTAPKDQEGWVGLAQGNKTMDLKYLGQNTSGMVVFTAPQEEGSYRLRLNGQNESEIMSLPFNVALPRISASPSSVRTCEKIQVSYSGAPGLDKDWIGMFSAGSSEPISKQYLNGNQMGNLSFSTTEAGNYNFRMFEAGATVPLCTSGNVEAVANAGVKVIAEPSRVSPGGTITVTFWGAPLSGTGVIGMYGMTRPDKFHIEKKPIGARSCGSITFRAPSAPGQYDFRMFENDVFRPLMGQSNVVTVA